VGNFLFSTLGLKKPLNTSLLGFIEKSYKFPKKPYFY